MKSYGELFHQGTLLEESGYFKLRQSMPYPLGESNSYLIETSEGWVVIDVGVDLPSTREVWEKAVKEIGISFKHIKKIYITHCHPDHLGAARWLQQVTEAPVFMLDEEIERANQFLYFESDFETHYRKAIEPECQRQGFRPGLVDELIRSWHYEVSPLFPQPEVILPLYKDQSIDLLGESFKIIPVPVHADGQFLLWNPKLEHLFIADLMAAEHYIHFSDWPLINNTDPLGSLFQAIDFLLALGEPQVFPGHGISFNYLPRLLNSLRERHLRKLDKVRDTVKGRVTAEELYPKLYRLVDYVHLDRVALGETSGYLEYLSSIGELQRSDQDGRIVYSR
ncbi:MAG: MBL fold metallo-hydrolase [Chitinophagales bacterium]